LGCLFSQHKILPLKLLDPLLTGSDRRGAGRFHDPVEQRFDPRTNVLYLRNQKPSARPGLQQAHLPDVMEHRLGDSDKAT
jgi:hypothetical protein